MYESNHNGIETSSVSFVSEAKLMKYESNHNGIETPYFIMFVICLTLRMNRTIMELRRDFNVTIEVKLLV